MSDLHQKINECLEPVRKLYVQACKDIAKEALEENPTDADAQENFLHESVDGSEWVIYTHVARAVAMISDNADAHEDFGSEYNTAELIAYCAMLYDCRHELTELLEQRSSDRAAS